MKVTEVYISLGSNIGDRYANLIEATHKIESIPEVFELKMSQIYVTTPVGPTPQNGYLNLVCYFKTTLNAKDLLHSLQQIEIEMGRKEKGLKRPRTIDLDIILFGLEFYKDSELTIPHPSWLERMFVLVPLSDLIHEVSVPSSEGVYKLNLHKFLETFPNIHHETVLLWKE
jgi:2-amino-4-hydroxy-6-hydroxymethyldihydropteridine diphosphokinase